MYWEIAIIGFLVGFTTPVVLAWHGIYASTLKFWCYWLLSMLCLIFIQGIILHLLHWKIQ